MPELPSQVASKDWRGKDVVVLGVKSGARPEVVAKLVVRCLRSSLRPSDFNGWHYLLEHDSCNDYVVAVINLVKQEASLRTEDVADRNYIIEQFSLPAQLGGHSVAC